MLLGSCPVIDLIGMRSDRKVDVRHEPSSPDRRRPADSAYLSGARGQDVTDELVTVLVDERNPYRPKKVLQIIVIRLARKKDCESGIGFTLIWWRFSVWL